MKLQNNSVTYLSIKKVSTGFTLIEIMVAIAVIAIISGVVITSTIRAQRQSRDDQRKTDLERVQSGLQQYYTDQGFYPNDSTLVLTTATQITNCTDPRGACSISKTYLDIIPHDPSLTSSYCYKSYTDSSKTIACDNTDPVITNHCHYYSLYAKLETVGSSSLSCRANSYNLEVNPS